MITKERLIDSLTDFPEEFSVDELLKHVIFIEKIERGRQDVLTGRVNTVTQARQKLDKWLK